MVSARRLLGNTSTEMSDWGMLLVLIDAANARDVIDKKCVQCIKADTCTINGAVFGLHETSA